MTILHIMQCTNLGGMEQVAFRTMALLADRENLQFKIVSPRPFGAGIEQVRNFDPHARDFRYRGRFGWRDFRVFRRYVRSVARECSHIWITGTCAASLAAVKGIKLQTLLSHHYHHIENSLSSIRWRMFYELFCHHLDAITYPVGFTRDEAVGIAPWLSAKAVIVPNPYRVQYAGEKDREERRIAARRHLGFPLDAYIIGGAGWLISRKRFDVFLQTAALVRERLAGSFFVICGNGPEEEYLRRLVHELGIEDVVQFKGWIRDLSNYYQAWDLLLFNSDFDTLPCVPMEAVSYGCPVVASVRRGGLNGFLQHERNGFLFEEHDIYALADAILLLAGDQSLTANMREAGRETLAADFSPEAGIEFYRSFFIPARE